MRTSIFSSVRNFGQSHPLERGFNRLRDFEVNQVKNRLKAVKTIEDEFRRDIISPNQAGIRKLEIGSLIVIAGIGYLFWTNRESIGRTARKTIQIAAPAVGTAFGGPAGFAIGSGLSQSLL